jgi:hypothetical protein
MKFDVSLSGYHQSIIVDENGDMKKRTRKKQTFMKLSLVDLFLAAIIYTAKEYTHEMFCKEQDT